MYYVKDEKIFEKYADEAAERYYEEEKKYKE